MPCDAQVAFVPDGLEAIIFTADGDMRQALNNLQARCCAPVFVRTSHKTRGLCQPARRRQQAHQLALQCCACHQRNDALCLPCTGVRM